MTQNPMTLNLFIEQEREGTYFTLPFTMPPGCESLKLRYRYPRFTESGGLPEQDSHPGRDSFFARQETNIVDLGLIAPDGTQVGVSGSDKDEVEVRETYATPGYHPHRLVPGEWQILVGAYKVAPPGVNVTYELSFTQKSLRLLKGDLHAHTLASDGVLTAEELGWLALRHGLDYLAITDHNQMVSRTGLPDVPGLTLIQGMEWTHFRGHAGFLGVDRPYDGSFMANRMEEVLARFDSARQRGALITLNHPFEPGMEFQFDIHSLPFDCLEIWNGPMRESNLRTVGLWQSLLAAGQKIPISGGSDYHRDTPFIFLGGPTTWVYAMSSGPSDILSAIRDGHAYITYAPDGPTLELKAGEAIMGDTVAWSEVREVQVSTGGLRAGDVIRVVTGKGSEAMFQAPAPGRFSTSYRLAAPGFARIEILRSFLPGIPPLPALISNPIYFED